MAVPQVYLARSPGLRLDQAVRVLGGFRRLVLRSGERCRVTVRVAARTCRRGTPAAVAGRSAPERAPSGWVRRRAI
ncbi:fibronectin type III-like domain-contianing protein [Streptomyces sp. NPDC059224]|uniref:fibronectin type III-like domain-contianing protein n=1 Tax=Streptomyces sp. NPDC059224 TaxID=3346775 RepID=UPI0036C3FF61